MIRKLFSLKKYFSVNFLIVLFTSQIYSQGSPPLLLDDTGTPGDGNWEINLVASLEHLEISDEWEAPLFDINYGVGERLQLKVEIPLLTQTEEGSETESSIEGIEFGLKYRFIGLDDEGSSISCYPQLFASLNNEGTGLFLPIEYHYQWEKYGLTAELGHSWSDGKDEGWEGGIGGAIHFRYVELLIEYHSKYEANNSEFVEPMIDIGIVWDWMDSSSLMFSIGKAIKSSKDETDLWTLAGLQFLL